MMRGWISWCYLYSYTRFQTPLGKEWWKILHSCFPSWFENSFVSLWPLIDWQMCHPFTRTHLLLPRVPIFHISAVGRPCTFTYRIPNGTFSHPYFHVSSDIFIRSQLFWVSLFLPQALSDDMFIALFFTPWPITQLGRVISSNETMNNYFFDWCIKKPCVLNGTRHASSDSIWLLLRRYPRSRLTSNVYCFLV